MEGQVGTTDLVHHTSLPKCTIFEGQGDALAGRWRLVLDGQGGKVWSAVLSSRRGLLLEGEEDNESAIILSRRGKTLDGQEGRPGSVLISSWWSDAEGTGSSQPAGHDTGWTDLIECAVTAASQLGLSPEEHGG